MVHVVTPWFNYNSSGTQDVVKESLHSALNPEHDDLDLTILVIDVSYTNNLPDLVRRCIDEVGD